MKAGDWEPYSHFMLSDRSRHMGGPFSIKEAWGMFCSDHAQWDLFGCGALMVEKQDSDACLGQVGINSGPLFPEWELGWMLYAEAEGRGYAYEAAIGLRDWALQERRLSTLVSYIAPENERSRKLAERMEASLDEEAPRPDPTDLVYRHFGLKQP